MRGPSSSHTAGSFHIGRMLRDLFGAQPARARITFDPAGSYAQVYREQGVDRGFAVALLGWSLADPRFFRVLERAPAEGLDIAFEVRSLETADHPNAVEIRLDSVGSALQGGTPSALRGGTHHLHAVARSIGGGSVEIVAIDDWPMRLTGEMYEALVETSARDDCERILREDGHVAGEIRAVERVGRALVHARRLAPLAADARGALQRLGCTSIREARPIAFVKRGAPLFASAAEMLAQAGVPETARASLGRIALAHEASLLGITQEEALAEMVRRLDVMIAAVKDGLSYTRLPSAGAELASAPVPSMQLLEPSARDVLHAEASGRVAIGGLHTRAAARALAAMHVNSRMGVVCAAPTGGSAGVLPAVIVTLMEEGRLRTSDSGLRTAAALALVAAGAIGVVVAARATFAAEVAGCQVEIGAAGAMAAAAVVEAAGGTAAQAADAAAIAFQNTKGSVCDLVQGIVEIPCHTRNAVAASSAFVCADLVLGGYRNPIPLDETVDAVYAVGRMLPAELRCTARGGLAVTPSALALQRRHGDE